MPSNAGAEEASFTCILSITPASVPWFVIPPAHKITHTHTCTCADKLKHMWKNHLSEEMPAFQSLYKLHHCHDVRREFYQGSLPAQLSSERFCRCIAMVRWNPNPFLLHMCMYAWVCGHISFIGRWRICVRIPGSSNIDFTRLYPVQHANQGL